MLTSPYSQPDCVNLLLIKGDKVEQIKQEGCRDNVIEVKSMAETEVSPDTAIVLIEVKSSKDNAIAAKNSVDRRMNYILQTLRIHAIKDVETMSHLQRDDLNFNMTTQATVKFKDFSLCLKIVNLLAEKLDRNVLINGPEFYHSTESLQAARKEVCIKAARIAREKALDLARVFSASLGKLISVHEDKSTANRLESTNIENIKYPFSQDKIICQSQITAKFELQVIQKKPQTLYKGF